MEAKNVEQSLPDMPTADAEERTHADDSVPVREIRVERIAVEATQGVLAAKVSPTYIYQILALRLRGNA